MNSGTFEEQGKIYTRNIQRLVACTMLELSNNQQRQLRFHHVKILTFTAGYAKKEAQVHADMRLVELKKSFSGLTDRAGG